MKYISTTPLTRTEWLAHRRKGIGGSDAAAALGLSRWATPLSVYCDKLGLSAPKPDTEPMRQGRAFEAEVAHRFSEATGLKLCRCNRILVSDTHPFMLANIDRRVLRQSAFIGLECKTTGRYTSASEADRTAPEHYWQCVHYMAVTGAPAWYLAILTLGRDFRWQRIERNEDDIARLIEAEARLWNEHIVPRIPPAPLGTDADAAALEALAHHRPATEAVTDATAPARKPPATEMQLELPGEADRAERIIDLRDERKRLDASLRLEEQLLEAALGGADKAACGRITVTRQSRETTRIDTKRLKAELPDVYASYRITSVSRTLRLTRPGT